MRLLTYVRTSAVKLIIRDFSKRQKHSVAVIGSGPAGFYTSHALLKTKNIQVSLFDKAPLPFGLVRFGVAPDHQDVKNVTNTFESIASSKDFSFHGNVTVDSSLLKKLRSCFDSVVLAIGCSQARTLPSIQQHPQIIQAHDFVGWMNADPAATERLKERQFKLQFTTDVVIIGQGNVALDVARLLCMPNETLIQQSDISTTALNDLSTAFIQKISICGRRGLNNVSFTIKELREQYNLLRTLDPPGCLEVDELSYARLKNTYMLKYREKLPRPEKRLYEFFDKIVKEYSHYESRKVSKHVSIKNFLSPVEPVFKGNTLTHFTFEQMTHIEDGTYTKVVPVKKPNRVSIPCQLVVLSLGYQDSPLAVELKSAMKEDDEAAVFTAGWADSGAKGVIINSMSSAFECASKVEEYLRSLPAKSEDEARTRLEQREELLQSLNDAVSWDDWLKVDAEERQRVASLGLAVPSPKSSSSAKTKSKNVKQPRERVKFESNKEIFDFLKKDKRD